MEVAFSTEARSSASVFRFFSDLSFALNIAYPAAVSARIKTILQDRWTPMGQQRRQVVDLRVKDCEERENFCSGKMKIFFCLKFIQVRRYENRLRELIILV
jgi:hypothetical protein